MKKLCTLVLFCCYLVNIPYVLKAIQNHHNLDSRIFTTEHGLSSTKVSCIVQDKRGFVWIGTEDGLNKFDGYGFTVYKRNSALRGSLVSNHITALYTDRNDNLWVGTIEGLQYYDKSNDNFVSTALNQPDYIVKQNQCNAIFQDRSGCLWFASSGLGVLRFDPKTSESVLFSPSHTHPGQSLCSGHIRAIDEDADGNLWFGSQDNGLSVYNPVKKSFTNYSVASGHLKSDVIFDLFKQKNGNMLISTIGVGVTVYDQKQKRFIAYPEAFSRGTARRTFCAIEDKEGAVWAGTDGLGVMRFRADQQSISPHPVFNEFMQEMGDSKIHYLFEDKKGNLWVGMHYKGLCVIHTGSNGFTNYRKINNEPNSLSYNHVMGVTADKDNNLWIATDGGGLNFFDRKSGRFTHYLHNPGNPNSISDNAIVSVFCDSKKRIWAGTYVGGLCMWDPDRRGFVTYRSNGKPDGLSSDYVKSIAEDKRGYLWLGTNGGGLSRFNPTDKTFRNFQTKDNKGLVNDYISVIFMDSRNRLWIGTYFGLSCMDTETETLTSFKMDSGLSSMAVYAIAEDEQGVIWIGTQNGLNRYNPDKNNFTSIRPSGQQISQVINGIVPHKENLWLSTNKGIVRFNPSSLSSKIYTRYDGLQSDEFILASYYKSPAGEIFFGGISGLNSFFPDAIEDKTDCPLTYITGLRIFNQSVAINQEVNGRVVLPQNVSQIEKIRLLYSDKSFTLEFTAPDAAVPANIIYACKLEGFDNEWIYYNSSQRFATYTNLNPGTYKFKVKASNDPEVWGDNVTSLTIVVEPPLWATWWARTLYFLLACGAVWLLLRFFTLRLKEKNELRIERFKMRQQEELTQAKMGFFTNISHEFRTPLTLIIGPLEQMMETETDPEKQQLHSMMHRNAERLLRLINQILELRKLEQGKMKLQVQQLELVSFVSDLLGSFTDLANRKHISLTYSYNASQVRVWYDPDLLDKCLFNILSNAFKFTPDGGKVSLDIREDEGGRVYITVSDNGVGMDKDTLQRVFERFYQGNSKQLTAGSGIGMHLAKSIAELHGGNITASSEMDKGSSFCLLILPGNSHFAVEQMALEDGFHRVEEKDTTDTKGTGASKVLDGSRTKQDTKSLETKKEQGVSDTQKATNEKQTTEVQGALDEQTFSEVLNGSTVTKQQQVQGAPNEQTASEEQEDAVGKKLTILVVEDDEDIRKYIRKELESRYQVEEAVNGALGLSKAKKILPDLVITDVMMPEMTGTELCKRLKTDAETCHIPVIILTAQSDLEHRIEGLETGADSYIPKPFNVKHLNVRIEKLIALRQTLKERFSKSLNMEAQEVTLTSTDERLLQHAIDYIRENLEDPELSVENMSKALGMSRTHLHRKLKALTNQSPIEFIKVIRMKQAAYLLSTGKLSVSEVGYKVGYNTPSYFSSSFNAHFGMSPTAYMEQRGNNDEEKKNIKQ